MKKWLCGFLAAMMTLMVFSACTSDVPSSTPSNTDDNSSDMESSLESEADPEENSELESEDENNQQEIPDCVKNVYDKVTAVSSENYPDLEIGDFETSTTGQLLFTVEDTSDESQTRTERTLKITFGSVQNNPEDSSYSVIFDMKKQNQVLKKWIALWMQTCDEALSYEDAQSKMQDFVNTYSSDAFSDVVECGEYLLLLSPGDNGSFGQTLTSTYKPCLWDSIDESEYVPVDYSTYKANDVNSGTKVVLKGTVKEVTIENPDDIAPSVVLTVQDDSDNQYTTVYSYTYTPITFSTGTKLVIYGAVGGNDERPLILVNKIVN